VNRADRCWWCRIDGLTRRVVLSLVASRTPYCRKHWKSLLLLLEWDPKLQESNGQLR
jgi:hypothetical protein